jgi:4-amino-4-deoxychorismate lyase
MSPLFETVRVLNRIPENIEGHNRRVARARMVILGLRDELDLKTHVIAPSHVDARLHRCRVVYSADVESVEFRPYKVPLIRTVRLMDATHVRYDHKFRDRSAIDQMVAQSGTDDILMVVNGEITDLSFANVVFYDGQRWVTPARPMLPGTKRELLLKLNTIDSATITPSNLGSFLFAAPINAMLDIGDVPPIEVSAIKT